MDASIGVRHNRYMISPLGRLGIWILAASLLTGCEAERTEVTAPLDADRMLIAENYNINPAIKVRNAVGSEMRIVDLIQTGGTVYQEDILNALSSDTGPKQTGWGFIVVVCIGSHGGVSGGDGVTYGGPAFPSRDNPGDVYLSAGEVRLAMSNHPQVDLVFLCTCDSAWLSSAYDFKDAFHATVLIGLFPNIFVGGVAQDPGATAAKFLDVFGEAVATYCDRRKRYVKGEISMSNPLIMRGEFGEWAYLYMIENYKGILDIQKRREILKRY